MSFDALSSPFGLRKWYMDCTASDGSFFVGYWARVRWGPLRLGYAGVIHSACGSEPPRASSTLRPGKGPSQSGDELVWNCHALGLHGRWKRLCPPVQRTLFDSDEGTVRWSCGVPRAMCRVSLRDEVFDGMGYAELLEMTVAPWRLPIRELRWGRWLSESTSVTWIDWRGPYPLSLVLEDGISSEGRVADDGVMIGDRRLSLTTDRVIRSGTLGATVLGSLGAIGNVLPPALARTHEQKWLSRGSLGPNRLQGWAIHERVVFGA